MICWTNRTEYDVPYEEFSQTTTAGTRKPMEKRKYELLTSTLWHSWLADLARGQELHSRKSCCLRVPSSLALHTTFGLPISTYIWQTNKSINDWTKQRLTKAKNASPWMSRTHLKWQDITYNTSMSRYKDMNNTSKWYKIQLHDVSCSPNKE